MTPVIEQVRDARTLLFVPGNRPERFAKAHESAPGLVVLDLEDAVPAAQKAAARAHAVEWLAAADIAPPVDGVTGAVHDTESVRGDVRYARRLGFTGKLCIHPRQVPVAEEALRPTDEEVRWARSVVEAAETHGVAVHEGRMVDKPVADRAQRILRTAGRTQRAAVDRDSGGQR
ncbi:aldolase/citrate lyase family protein [Streptomyces sp. NPDC050619]|uniref:aldolase/citrate lyase family protein n=1 Tax=Streptomyces sp. NPDC050619 TaxID=3157214 RepID=UPI00343FFA1B